MIVHVAATAATVDGTANVLALIAVVACVAVALAVGITAAVSRTRVKSIAVHRAVLSARSKHDRCETALVVLTLSKYP